LVFIQVPSLEVLERRLRARGTDDAATINRRLATARLELEMARHYDVQVINDDLDRSVEELASILIQNGCGAGKNHD
jgi:guanylate kinase